MRSLWQQRSPPGVSAVGAWAKIGCSLPPAIPLPSEQGLEEERSKEQLPWGDNSSVRVPGAA